MLDSSRDRLAPPAAMATSAAEHQLGVERPGSSASVWHRWRTRTRPDLLTHPVLLVAVATLVINDGWAKHTWPGFVTGKLSDFAGVAMLTILAVAAGIHPCTAGVSVAAAFAGLKTVPGIAEAAVPILGGITRRDPTDLVALAGVVPLAVWLDRHPASSGPGRDAVRLALRIVVVAAAVLATTASEDDYVARDEDPYLDGPLALHPQGPYTHPATGFVMPEQVGPFKRSEVLQYDQAGRNVSARYDTGTGSEPPGPVFAILDVYPAPPGTDLDTEFDHLLKVIGSALGVSTPEATKSVNVADGRFDARYAAFRSTVPSNGSVPSIPVITYVLLYRWNDWWVKWDIAMPSPMSEAAKAALDLTETLLPPEIAAGDFSPRFSPDGDRIVFVRGHRNGGNTDLYVVFLASGETVQVADFWESDLDPVFSPDGTEILFDSSLNGPAQLFLVPASGGQPRAISEVGDGYAIDPTWSPDGTEIVYSCGSSLDTVDLCVMSPTDRSVRVLGGRSSSQETGPAWSPDGATVAFASDRTGDGDLYAIDVRSGDIRQLTHDPADESDPTWSPDGRTIAFTGTGSQICLLDVDDGTWRCLTEGIHPSWSPTGDEIAFYRYTSSGSRIFVLDVRSGETRQVT